MYHNIMKSDFRPLGNDNILFGFADDITFLVLEHCPIDAVGRAFRSTLSDVFLVF